MVDLDLCPGDEEALMDHVAWLAFGFIFGSFLYKVGKEILRILREK